MIAKMSRHGEVVESPEFVVDDDGEFAPCLDEARPVQTPADEGCKEALRALLVEHGRLVVIAFFPNARRVLASRGGVAGPGAAW